jgi:hypothetical protein
VKQHERKGRASLYARTSVLLTCFDEPFFDEGHDHINIVTFLISVIICDAVYAFIVRDDCAFIQNGVLIFSERVCHTLTEIAVRVLFPSL